MNTQAEKDFQFWQNKRNFEGGTLKNSWYGNFFTQYFKISPSFYSGKKVLDIGCGPRGTLEWADMTKERIGLDRFADHYAQLGCSNHKMKYVSASAESIPFEDNYFDVVTAFNSLELMSKLDETLAEIQRVTKPGGIFLVIADVSPNFQKKFSVGTPTELTQKLEQHLELIEAHYYEKTSGGIYRNLDQNIVYDFDNTSPRAFIASLILCKPNLAINVPKQPKVSVIVSVTNTILYMWQSIESILNQSYTSREIIVVDNSSNPENYNRLKPYENQIVYIGEDKQNDASLLNQGIKRATGDLITFLDTNNFWTSKEKLAHQVAYFDSEPNLAMVHSGWCLVNKANEITTKIEPWRKMPDFNLRHCLFHKYVKLNAMMISRQWLNKLGGFDRQLNHYYVLDLILRLLIADANVSWYEEIVVSDRLSQQNPIALQGNIDRELTKILDSFFARSNLPLEIKEAESEIYYYSLVQLAWNNYEKGLSAITINYLAESRKFSALLQIETIMDWVDKLVSFSQESQKEFDLDTFSESEEWKKLVLTK